MAVTVGELLVNFEVNFESFERALAQVQDALENLRDTEITISTNLSNFQQDFGKVESTLSATVAEATTQINTTLATIQEQIAQTTEMVLGSLSEIREAVLENISGETEEAFGSFRRAASIAFNSVARVFGVFRTRAKETALTLKSELFVATDTLAVGIKKSLSGPISKTIILLASLATSATVATIVFKEFAATINAVKGTAGTFEIVTDVLADKYLALGDVIKTITTAWKDLGKEIETVGAANFALIEIFNILTLKFDQINKSLQVLLGLGLGLFISKLARGFAFAEITKFGENLKQGFVGAASPIKALSRTFLFLDSVVSLTENKFLRMFNNAFRAAVIFLNPLTTMLTIFPVLNSLFDFTRNLFQKTRIAAGKLFGNFSATVQSFLLQGIKLGDVIVSPFSRGIKEVKSFVSSFAETRLAFVDVANKARKLEGANEKAFKSGAKNLSALARAPIGVNFQALGQVAVESSRMVQKSVNKIVGFAQFLTETVLELSGRSQKEITDKIRQIEVDARKSANSAAQQTREIASRAVTDFEKLGNTLGRKFVTLSSKFSEISLLIFDRGFFKGLLIDFPIALGKLAGKIGAPFFAPLKKGFFGVISVMDKLTGRGPMVKEALKDSLGKELATDKAKVFQQVINVLNVELKKLTDEAERVAVSVKTKIPLAFQSAKSAMLLFVGAGASVVGFFTGLAAKIPFEKIGAFGGFLAGQVLNQIGRFAAFVSEKFSKIVSEDAPKVSRFFELVANTVRTKSKSLVAVFQGFFSLLGGLIKTGFAKVAGFATGIGQALFGKREKIAVRKEEIIAAAREEGRERSRARIEAIEQSAEKVRAKIAEAERKLALEQSRLVKAGFGGQAAEGLKQAFTGIKAPVSGATQEIDRLITAITQIGTVVQKAAGESTAALKMPLMEIKETISKAQELKQQVQDAFEKPRAGVANTSQIMQRFEQQVQSVAVGAEALGKVIQVDFKDASKTFKDAASATQEVVESQKVLVEGVKEVSKEVKNLVDSFKKIGTTATAIGEAGAGTFVGIGTAIRKVFISTQESEVFVRNIRSAFRTTGKQISEELKNISTQSKENFKAAGFNVDEFVKKIQKITSQKIEPETFKFDKEKFKQAEADLETFLGAIGVKLKNLPKMSAAEGAAAIGKALREGLKKGEADAALAMESFLNVLAEFFPKSDAKRGPFSTLTKRGTALVNTFMMGVTGAQGAADSAMAKFTQGIADFLPSSNSKKGALSRLSAVGGALVGTIAGGIPTAAALGIGGFVAGKILQGLTNKLRALPSLIKTKFTDVIRRGLEGAFRPTQVADTFKGAIEGFTKIVGLEPLKDFTDFLLGSTVKLSRVSERLGVTTESLSSLNFAARKFGADATQMEFILSRLADTTTKAVNEPLSEAANTFQLLGINLKEVASSTEPTLEALLQLSDILQTADRNTEVFKKALTTASIVPTSPILNLLKQGGPQLRAIAKEATSANNAISGALSSLALKAEESFVSLKQSVEGFKKSVAAVLLPFLVEVATNLNNTFKANQAQFKAVVITVVNVLRILGEAFGRFIKMARKEPAAAIRFISQIVQNFFDFFKKSILAFINQLPPIILAAVDLIEFATTNRVKAIVAETLAFIINGTITLIARMGFIIRVGTLAIWNRVKLSTIERYEQLKTILLTRIAKLKIGDNFLTKFLGISKKEATAGIAEANRRVAAARVAFEKETESLAFQFGTIEDKVEQVFGKTKTKIRETITGFSAFKANQEEVAGAADRLGNAIVSFGAAGKGAFADLKKAATTLRQELAKTAIEFGFDDIVAKLQKTVDPKQIEAIAVQVKVKLDKIKKDLETFQPKPINIAPAIANLDAVLRKTSAESVKELMSAFSGLDLSIQKTFRNSAGFLTSFGEQIRREVTLGVTEATRNVRIAIQATEGTLRRVRAQISQTTDPKRLEVLKAQAMELGEVLEGARAQLKSLEEAAAAKTFVSSLSDQFGILKQIQDELKTTRDKNTETIDAAIIKLTELEQAIKSAGDALPPKVKKQLLDNIELAKENAGVVARNFAREMAETLASQLTSALNVFLEKGGTIMEKLKKIGENLFNTGIQNVLKELKTSASGVFQKLFQSFGVGGEFGNAILGGVMAAAGLLISRLESQTKVITKGVESAVEKTKQLRGVVAGETQIGIFEVGESLRGINQPVIAELQGIRETLGNMLALMTAQSPANVGFITGRT